MAKDTNKILNEILYLIINLPNFERTSKRYWEKFKMLDEYTGVKSIRTDREIAGGEGKSYADIIIEKDNCYKDYLYYAGKVEDIYNMLGILDGIEREVIVDWYTTPKNYRKKSEDFASDKGLSRRSMFNYKKIALQKLVKYYNK